MTSLNQSQDFQTRWSSDDPAVEGHPPRKTLLTALESYNSASHDSAAGIAIDLGCGDGRDTVELCRMHGAEH